jgi:formylglycine-generating enzyme required for sulfatase activity
MHRILLLIFAANYLACGTFAQAPDSGFQNEVFQVNYSKLSDGAYISKTELTILDYLLYLEAIKTDSSDQYYQTQLPDSTALDYVRKANEEICGCGPMYISRYAHPAYREYPAFGISYSQVINYCKWKTAKLDTLIISKDGYDNYYLISYRLPTTAEWEQANSQEKYVISKTNLGKYSYSYLQDISQSVYDSLSIKKRLWDNVQKANYNISDIGKFILKDSIYTYKKREVNCYMSKAQPAPSFNCLENKLGLFNMNSNLSEMVQTEGIAMGHNFNSISTDNDIILYSKPQAWIGARLACRPVLIAKRKPNK